MKTFAELKQQVLAYVKRKPVLVDPAPDTLKNLRKKNRDLKKELEQIGTCYDACSELRDQVIADLCEALNDLRSAEHLERLVQIPAFIDLLGDDEKRELACELLRRLGVIEADNDE